MSLDAIYELMGVIAAVVGLSIGSFLNVCIVRMPEDRSIAFPASHCPTCGHAIRPYDNVPVLAWLWLKGRCRDCGTRISPLYPLVEALTGVVAWLLYRRVVHDVGDFDTAHLAAWALLLVFAGMLIAQSFIDLRHYIIPDEFTIYAVPVGVGGWALVGWLGYPAALSWQDAVVGALIGGGSLTVIIVGYRLVRGLWAMGWGDVKLLAMIGAFTGVVPALPFVVILASIVGSAIGLTMAVARRKGLQLAVPFGPMLAAGALAWILRGPELVDLYLSLLPDVRTY